MTVIEGMVFAMCLIALILIVTAALLVIFQVWKRTY